MTQALEQLSSRGYKLTPQRRLILEVLEKSDIHLSAEEIARRVNELQPGISVATIYRNLNMLVDINIIGKLNIHDGPSRYELNQGHNHHMVCLDCGAAIKLGFCPMQGEIEKLIKESGFKVNDHHFEITGYCHKCQQKRKEGV